MKSLFTSIKATNTTRFLAFSGPTRAHAYRLTAAHNANSPALGVLSIEVDECLGDHYILDIPYQYIKTFLIF